MRHSLYTLAVLTAYQFAIVAGIAVMPLALVTSRFGVTPRIDPVVERLGTAYENANESTPAADS